MTRITTEIMKQGALVLSIVASVAGCQQEEGTPIGPRGGIISSADGHFSVEIPGGALTEEVAITIEEVDCEPNQAIDACFEVGPVGLPLLRPATVTYQVDEQMLEDFAPEALTVLVEGEEAWAELADRSVDSRAVTASAVYLSSFALIAAD